MPFYLPEHPGILGGLIGAASTYFNTKEQMQNDAQQRELQKQQMQQAAELAPLEIAGKKADIAYKNAQVDAEKAATAPFAGMPGNLQNAPAAPAFPGAAKDPTQRSHSLGAYVATMSGVAAFYGKQREYLSTLYPTDTVKAMIQNAKDNEAAARAQIDMAEKEIDHIGDMQQTATEHLDFMKASKAIPQVRIFNTTSRSSGTERVDYGNLRTMKTSMDRFLVSHPNATPAQIQDAMQQTMQHFNPNDRTADMFQSYVEARSTTPSALSPDPMKGFGSNP